MSGWDSTCLLEYMSKRPKFYGEKWQHITSADHSYLAKCFTDSVIRHLDLSTIAVLPFAEICYTGKGDPNGVLIDPGYCFTDKQITDIMNFICSDDSDTRFSFQLSEHKSFCIEMYLTRSISLRKDWFHSLRTAVSKGDI